MGVSTRPQHQNSHPIPIKNLREPTASLRILEKHNFQISGLAWSNDSRTLYSSSGGADRCVRVWDASSGKELKRIEWTSINPHCLALSLDEQFLAIGDDPFVHIWDLEAQEEVATLKGIATGATWLEDVAFTPDGGAAGSLRVASNRLITATVKPKQMQGGVWVQVRKLPGLEVSTEFEVDSYSTVDAVAISSNGRFVAAGHGGSDRNQHRRAVTVWDVSTGNELGRHEFERNGNRITGLAFDPNNQTPTLPVNPMLYMLLTGARET